MAIRITCPGCKSTLSLADESRGKKVRCKKCETVVKVPDADAGKRKRDDEEETPQKTVAAASNDDEDEEEEQPKKKKKKKAKKAMSPLLIVIPVLVVVLLLVGGVSAFLMTRDPGPAKQQQAKVQQKFEEEVQKPQIFNKIQDGSPTKKGGTGIVNSIRGAVWRTERRSELANLNKLYQAFILETPRGQQTLENYLTYIQRDFRPGHDAIKEGYYVMNMNAKGGDDIVAGERDLDLQGHLAVFYNANLQYVPEAEWKKAMNIK